MQYLQIDFEQFKTVYGVIEIPQNTLFIRGHHQDFPAISSRPAYFSQSFQTACGYGKREKCKVSMFVTTKPIRLYDLRYLKLILSDCIVNRKSNKNTVIDAIFTWTLAFGMCTLSRQIDLYKERYRDDMDKSVVSRMQSYLQHMSQNKPLNANPVEVSGIRIAETINDAHAVVFLKEMFGNEVDGYIAPRFETPYHAEKNGSMSSELLLFDPESAGLKLLNITEAKELQQQGRINKLSLEHVLTGLYILHDLPLSDDVFSAWFGGGTGAELAKRNQLFDTKIKKVERMQSKAKKTIELLKYGQQKPRIHELQISAWKSIW